MGRTSCSRTWRPAILPVVLRHEIDAVLAAAVATAMLVALFHAGSGGLRHFLAR